MSKIKTILLIFVMGVILFPWQLICLTHPFGHSHQHHEPGKLSPCELHKKYAGKGTCFLPIMHCQKISADTDNYQAPSKFQINPTFQLLAIVLVLVDDINLDNSEHPYLLPPEPKCRSATLISKNTLRGPPLI